ncbi:MULTISPECIES: hypothetical protein [unclassified Streptomyces]|uniref:hypothetical protein n=1 Tax=unclassified Streptomyces TaxID=2593676 RepID=UPI0022512DB0|nr:MULTISPECIES: hypothetical protein [unclassified Streptomyces]MCX5142403.1 hypothetical protein [Streptomyces sp. NBC_00338]WRZ66852.1 hypothetical protein OG408_24580 [Streptomyces sp. NBC_01257]WSU60861.1 hypothetical protein OG450_24840 [Streptomyces sp. NBC_01104]
MSLLELIAAADARGLAASGTACLDRCLPQPADGAEPDPLRPLWSGCADPDAWPDRLADARTALDALPETEETVLRIRKLLGEAPADRAEAELRAWADACSVLALDIHRGHDAARSDATELVDRCRTGEPGGAGPLLSGEAARQVRILEMLAEIGDGAPTGAGLRQVMDVSTEGQRVLRAAASRRARVRG